MSRFQRILCPVDFSQATRGAVEVAGATARAVGAELWLLHVLDFPHQSVALERYYLEIEDEAIRRLADIGRCPGLEGLAVRDAVVRGTPYEAIVEFAQAREMDIIVLATHGRAGLDRLLVGSVSERVARMAKCAVLTVPPGGTRARPWSPLRVLLATDFSATADQAMVYAEAMADAFGAELELVHVVTLGERGEYGRGWEMPSLPPVVEEQVLREASEGLALRAQRASSKVGTRLIRGPHPALEIAEHAAHVGVDLIVAASQGHSAIGRVLLGSTTEKLIRYGRTPVLVVRARSD